MGRSGEDAPRGRTLWEAVRVSLEAAGKCFLRKKPGPKQSKYWYKRGNVCEAKQGHTRPAALVTWSQEWDRRGLAEDVPGDLCRSVL